MKTRSLSLNLSMLARADISCQFMKARFLCRTVYTMIGLYYLWSVLETMLLPPQSAATLKYTNFRKYAITDWHYIKLHFFQGRLPQFPKKDWTIELCQKLSKNWYILLVFCCYLECWIFSYVVGYVVLKNSKTPLRNM